MVLKDLLDGGSDIEVFPTNDMGVQHTGHRVQRVDSGTYVQLSDGMRQYSGGIRVGKGGSRGGIGQIIGGDIDNLNRNNRTLLCGGDTSLPIGSNQKNTVEELTCTDMPPISVERIG